MRGIAKSACVHLPSLPPGSLPRPARGGRAPLPRPRPGWQHREEQLWQPPRGREGAADGDPRMCVSERSSCAREPSLKALWILSAFALHLPAPPVAFRAYVSAPRLGSPPPAPLIPGGPGHGEPRGLNPPGAPRASPAGSAPRRADLQPGPRQKAQGMLTRPVSATCPQPGRHGRAGEAPPFCPRASLHAHPVDLSPAQRGAELL